MTCSLEATPSPCYLQLLLSLCVSPGAPGVVLVAAARDSNPGLGALHYGGPDAGRRLQLHGQPYSPLEHHTAVHVV